MLQLARPALLAGLMLLVGCSSGPGRWFGSGDRAVAATGYAEVEPFRIELAYAGELWIVADSEAGVVQVLRAPLQRLEVASGPPPVVHEHALTPDQRQGLARWTAQFLAGGHPEAYPARAPRPFVGAARSRLVVNSIEVAWDNTSDAPALRAQVMRLIDLAEGPRTIAGRFRP
jgi:hypothetical protein